MKNKKKKVTIIFLLIITAFFNFAIPSAAHNTENWYTDSTSGYEITHNPVHYHMGTKSTTYKFQNATVKLYYEGNMNDAVANWGTDITCTYSASSTKGIVKMQPDRNNRNAYATGGGTSYNSSGHVNTWEIMTYVLYDEIASTSHRAVILSHEIGHVYGLSHFNGTNNITNENVGYGPGNNTISTSERNGMSVCTHAHSNHSSFIYTSYGTQHVKRCGICMVYTQEPHNPFTCPYCN